MKTKAYVLALTFLSIFKLSLALAENPPIKMLPENEYNYDFFFMDLSWGKGLKFNDGAQFPNTEVYHLGKKQFITTHSLFHRRPVVLEIGSITCPVFMSTKDKMNELAKKYKNKVDFYTLYVRENHPRKVITNHKTMKQKIQYAEEYEKDWKPAYPTLVDKIGGDLHQLLGNYPNAVFVIGKDGILFYLNKFNKPENLDGIIKMALANDGKGKGLGLIMEEHEGPDRNTPQYKKLMDKVFSKAGELPEKFAKQRQSIMQNLVQKEDSYDEILEKEEMKHYNELKKLWEEERSKIKH